MSVYNNINNNEAIIEMEKRLIKHVNTTFTNNFYHYPRRAMKTIVIDSIGHDLVSDTNWSVIFKEPMFIDKLSDIHLDSITTYQAKSNMYESSDCMGIILNINEFDINSNSASKATSVGTGKFVGSHPTNESVPIHDSHFNKIFIPNESDNVHKVVVHKGKKLNYVATINPCSITQLNGSITNLADNTAFENVEQESVFTAMTTQIHTTTTSSKVVFSSALPQVIPGFIVSGTDVPANTIVKAVYNNGTVFRLTNNIGSVTNRDLTFTGDAAIKGRFVAEFYIIPRD